MLFLPEEAEEFPLLVISQLKRFVVKFQFSIFNFQFEFGLKLEMSQTLPSCIFKQSHSAWDETYLLKKKKKFYESYKRIEFQALNENVQ